MLMKSGQPIDERQRVCQKKNADDMMNQNASHAPSGIEQDVRSDEEIIDQTTSAPVKEETELQQAPIVEQPTVGNETPLTTWPVR